MFRSSSLSRFGRYFAGMFGLCGNTFTDAETLFYWKQLAVVLPVGLLFCFPVILWFSEKLCSRHGNSVIHLGSPVIYGIALAIAIAFAFSGSYQAFVYFRF